MLDHLQACPYCPHFVDDGITTGWCKQYKDINWVNRRGGCPMFPYRDLPPRANMEYLDGKIVSGVNRPGQQKQKTSDRKYENRKVRRKYGAKLHS